ncbi:hypothetical protein FB45DRAFT_1103242 [Roridomyces roridus]|uniref:F-box domain-containing protein n=1 Tax=Roridomyces roridus TaxID=1738132 RepID=A0AAD7BE76_9AGAR|nr:hypothetical protein FB45DRAFT_1103242 [Roridomyces roridus]
MGVEQWSVQSKPACRAVNGTGIRSELSSIFGGDRNLSLKDVIDQNLDPYFGGKRADKTELKNKILRLGILPDEVLAVIFKLVSDALTKPAAHLVSIAMARVNRRWRIVALHSPELWTTIRISHRLPSLHWAAVFISRSQSLPLDISINFEGYLRKPKDVDRFLEPEYPPYVSLDKILPIIAPHLSRWRTVAFRGWPSHLGHFEQFISSAPPSSTSRIESLHLSNAETCWCTYDEPTSVPPPRLYKLRALKLDGLSWDAGVLLQPIRMLRALDIDLRDQEEAGLEILRPLLENPTAQLRTLVLRGFSLHRIQHPPIEAHSLRSLAVNLYSAGYWGSNDRGAGFKTITALLVMPNLERLELLGGFRGLYRAEEEPMGFYGPTDVWNPPLFQACLRELRIQGVRFSPANVELIHSAGLWPRLRDITVESVDEDTRWLGGFVSMRGAHDLVVRLLPSSTITDLVQRGGPSIRWLWDGPSHNLFDNISPSGHGFYLDGADGPVDFEYVVHPRWCVCHEQKTDSESWRWEGVWEDDHAYDDEQLDAEISEAFKMMGGIRRERRVAFEKRDDHERRLSRVSGKINGNGRRRRRRGRIEIGEDFAL